jgi:hypothetical protein
MDSLEAGDSSVGGVCPQIEALLKSLNRQAGVMECEMTRRLSLECIAIINRLSLDTTNGIFQLAYVLTPSGRMR